MAKDIDFFVNMTDRGVVQTSTKVERALTGMDNKNKEVTRSQDNMSKSSGSLWKQIGLGVGVASLAVKAVTSLTAAFSAGVTDAVEFDKAMANVSTLVDTSTVNMGDYEAAILGMAGSLGSATDLTNGLYQALSAGVEPAKAIEFVGTSAKFAQAALTDTLGAVDVLSTVINAYGMNASDAAHVSDVLFQTIKDGKTTGEQLAGALGRVIPAAATMGVNLETVSAALATMTKGGISTDEAVTALNATLMAVIKPSSEAAKTAEKMGIDFSKAGIEGAGGFHAWLQKLKIAVGDNETKMAALFPNVRALKSVLALTGTQAEEFTKIMGNMADVNGNVDTGFQKQQQSIGAMVSTLKNELSAAFTQNILPALRSVVAALLEMKDVITDVIGTVSGLFQGLYNVVDFLVSNTIDGLEFWFSRLKVLGLDVMGVINGIIDGYRELIALINGEHAKAIDKQIDTIKTLVDQEKTLRDTLIELRDATGMASDKMVELSQELAGIEDPARKMGAQINALKLEELAKNAGLTAIELEKIKSDFSDIEDPARRYQKILRAIKDGKYDNEFKNLSKELDNTSSEFSVTKEEADNAANGIKSVRSEADELKESFDKIPFSSVNIGFQGLQSPIKKTEDMYGELLNAVTKEIIKEREATATRDELNRITQEAIDHVEGLKSKNEELAASFINIGQTIGTVFETLSSLGVNFSDSITSSLGALDEHMQNSSALMQSYMTGDVMGMINNGIKALGSQIKVATSVFNALFGSKGELEAAERRLTGISGLTQDWGKEIEALAKEIGGAGSAEKAFNQLLPQIIADSSSTIQNFDTLIGKTRDIISVWQWAGGSIEDVEQQFGDAFVAMTGMAVDLGQEGSASFIGLMELADEFGLKIDDIATYKAENMKSAVDGWRVAMEHFSGVSIPALDEIIRLEDMIADNQELVNSIKGAEDALIGLSNAGRINEDTFQSFEDIALQALQDLQDKGFTVTDALSADTGLQGLLERLIFLSEEYGFVIDDDTQKLIDQGIEAGILSENTQTEQEAMLEGFDRIVNSLDNIARGLGIDIPNSLEEMSRRSNTVLTNVESQTNSWNNSIRDVYSNLNDVENKIGDIGDKHNDMMYGHSVIPELEEWKKSMHDLRENEMDETIMKLEKMSDMHSYSTGTILSNNTKAQNSYKALELQMIKAFSVSNQEMKPDEPINTISNPITDKPDGELMPDKINGDILAQIKALEKEISDNIYVANDAILQGWPETAAQILGYNNELKKEIEKLKANLKNFRIGTPPGGFKVPPGFPDDSFLIGASTGETVNIRPDASSNAIASNNISDSGGNTYNFYGQINASPTGDTPEQLMKKFWLGVKYDKGGYRTKLQNEYFQKKTR